MPDHVQSQPEFPQATTAVRRRSPRALTRRPTQAELLTPTDMHASALPASMPAGAPLEESVALLRSIIEMAPDGIVVVDAAGYIQMVNQQTERLFSYSRNELRGATLELLVPERFHGIHIQHRAHYLATPHTRPMGINLELAGRRKDGSEFPVEISLAHLQTESGPLVISSIRDVTQRKRLEEALHAAEQQAHAAAAAQLHTLQMIIAELPSGICLVRGEDARLVLANRAVDELWGAHWTSGQAMADFLAVSGIRVLTPSGQPLPPEQLAALRAVRGEVVRQHQQIVRHTDGITLPFVVNAVPLEPEVLNGLLPPTDATNHEPTALVVYQDVTALKDAERLKDEFVALAAHELRNPMAALKGYATMLQTETRRMPSADESDFATEAATEIARATDRLVALTDDLLDVTRLQAGRLELHAEPHDLVALVRRVARRLAVTTDQHTFSIDAQAEFLVVKIDVRRMEQVVTNLLNNAIKYSPAGGEVVLTLREDEPGWAQMSVRDSGIGIPLAEQAHIFARFARAQNARAQGIHGTGLGLYLCRELVERHGGHIWFDSVEGAGSTFSFTLPEVAEADES